MMGWGSPSAEAPREDRPHGSGGGGGGGGPPARGGGGDAGGGPEARQERALEEEVERLLLGHRRAFEEIRAGESERRASMRREALRKPFEVLEMAYQAALQIMMALLVPKVHPIVPHLSRVLMRRDYPAELALPSLAVFVSGLHAKLALDTANLWGMIPFRWVQPRPLRRELVHPLSPRGLELNLVGSLAGVCVGRAMVLVRQGLRLSAEALLGAEPPALLRWVAASALHLTASSILAPLIVGGLSASLRDAQFRGRPLLPTALGRLWRFLSLGVVRVAHAGSEAIGAGDLLSGYIAEVPYWAGAEDAQVPEDFLCPITGSIFVHPVSLHGMVFEEHAARRWVESTGRHPVLQGVWCHEAELQPARDVEALCRRLAAEHGWVLRSSHCSQ